ncbi:dedicator of cytokinesis protein 4 isoform X2 [Frankliniella occidentalis]|uniref:Dedicator of cytokinesis protein 4 isoform X2 n=1 Tax=Frankliniella occidentalis TaxID=133901 RepID=A0A9C6UCC8_FRAOC|nr:dedicator of cytokinesis protein 4 isoform X2 [Frankliniella occidentalis]
MWTATKTKKYGVAVYNWKGDTRYGLPLEIGDTVQIHEECLGWYRGFATKNRTVKGIFPVSYIFIKPSKVDNEGPVDSVVPIEDPVVREVTLVLREWGIIWKRLYVERENFKFTNLRKVMRDLLDWRRQLLTGTLTQDQTRELKLKITAKIDWGNRKLGLDLVPRCGAEMVDPANMSVVELYHVHVQSFENSREASSRGTMKRKETRKVLTHHLSFCMRDFGHHIGEDTEIYFSLYDTKKSKYISERFLVRISKDGFSNYVEKLHSNCTIFTDLGNADLCQEIYLVAHVMRVGRMLYSESSKKSSSGTSGGSSAFANSNLFRRPVGVAVHNISEFLALGQSHLLSGSPNAGGSYSTNTLSASGNMWTSTSATLGEEREFTIKVFQGEEKDFYQLHELIIKKQSNKYNVLSGQNYGIGVSLKFLHGELSQVQEENPLLFKNISLTKKLGFSDVIMPGDIRNDLYLTLERGEFERGGKSTAKNIEVTILVLDSDGKPLEKCLWGASGSDGTTEYQSMIVYHHNSPSWMETVRLAVPIDKFYGSHVRLEYRHCSTREKADNKKLFGFSFVRLMEPGGATLGDRSHELYIYKCEDRSRLNDPQVYLSLSSGAWEGIGQSNSTAFGRSHKETVFINTLLCSTKLTQNADLLSLLRWKDYERPQTVQDALTSVLRLNGEEIVKFLQDVLDALFAMFSTEDGNSTTHSGLVFHVLVSIFSHLEDSRFEHFRPVMDAYIKGHFAAALVYKGLMTSVQHCAERVSSTDKQEPMQKCFGSLEYIFKFIIESRLLFSRATGGQYEDSFRRDLYLVFNALTKMLGTSYEVILPTQVALLHSISAVLEQLTQVLHVPEVSHLASNMLESLPTRDLSPQLTQAKLVAVRNLVTSKLFQHDESRSQLLGMCCKQLRMHLAHRDELRLCTEILGEILGYLFKQRQSQLQEQGKVNNCLHHDVEILCLHILDILVQTVLIIIDRPTPVLGSLVACLIGLLQLLDEYHYSSLWEDLGDHKPTKDFLLRVFLVFRDLVKQEVFPSDWLIIKMVANQVILNSLKELSEPLVSKFLDDGRCHHFDNQLWTQYFNLAVAFLTQPSLQLEQFSEVKREKMMERYGDMRVLMGFQILNMWSRLGEHKIKFIPHMVGPFLEVTLVPEAELRKATLHIFFDMMECEQRARGNFKQVESELIDKLDILISENKGDDEYRQLFNTILLQQVQNKDPTWKESGTAFISSVTRLLERLLDYRSVMQGDENRDKRMSCTVNLLNFYKNEINRKEMYLRYIYKLHDLHFPAENFTEAGFTMKLYADQLTWNSTPLSGDPHHNNMSECQRKQHLYMQIINYFDKGKCWEKGIPLCKELAELYEKKLFDYGKLSNILKTQAKFFDNILTQLRPEPEYFRVGFYGLSFPLFVRNKVFVYRGLEYERIGAFTQRLQTEFPAAQILMKNTPPDDSIINSEGQYIQICNVKPIPELNPVFSSEGALPSDIPEKITSFYEVNDVKRFQFDRPIHKGTVDKENEFKSLWLERTTLVIASSLPGILRWFEVVERTVEEITPVQFACETMETVNKELRQLISQYEQDSKRNINPFTMRLQGIIDANVMGGIAKYQQAFFSPEFSKSNPECAEHVYSLKTLILEQVHILSNALALHGQLAPPGVQPLHRRLQERLGQMEQGLRELSSGLSLPRHWGTNQHSIVHTPLPPLPSEKRMPMDGISNRSSCSSGAYGHFISNDHFGGSEVDDDTIYSKPMDMNGVNSPPAIPQRDLRPRSSNFTSNSAGSTARTPTRGTLDYSSLPPMKSRMESHVDGEIQRPPKPSHQRSLSISRPDSPKPLALRHSLPTPTDGVLSTWDGATTPNTGEEAPPLPPRGCTPDKRGLYIDTGQQPPAPPRRPLSKKGSAPTMFNSESSMDLNLDISDGYGEGTNTPLTTPVTPGAPTGDDSGLGDVTPTPSSAPTPTSATPLSAQHFNNLSYEDFEFTSRTPSNNLGSRSDTSQDPMNIVPPVLSPRSQIIAAPPPIPPKALSNITTSVESIASQDTSDRSDSGSCRGSTGSGGSGSGVENYSVPRLQTTPVSITVDGSCSSNNLSS